MIFYINQRNNTSPHLIVTSKYTQIHSFTSKIISKFVAEIAGLDVFVQMKVEGVYSVLNSYLWN